MLVETAIVFPVFAMFMAGIFAFTFVLIRYLSATYAANEGVRYASLKSDTSFAPATTTQIANVVRANLFLMPGPADTTTILVYYGNRSGTPGNTVGDDIGVGVIVFNQPITIPFWGTKTFELECQAYRFISR